MNRLLLPLLILFFTAASLKAQTPIEGNRPMVGLSSDPGYIVINELTYGPGLGIISAPYSRYLFGFTTIHGYQVNQSFVVAAGTGFSVYNGGSMIPLFMDFRYRFLVNTFTPYLLGDGGVLFNTSGGAKLFINPAAGVRYSLNRNVGFTFSTGLFVQTGKGVRDSYINFKLGAVIKL